MDLKKICLYFSIFFLFFGLILFLDEIHMVFPFLGIKRGFLGDWSDFHIAGIHHWVFGLILMIISVVGIYLSIKSNKKPRGSQPTTRKRPIRETKIKFPKRK